MIDIQVGDRVEILGHDREGVVMRVNRYPVNVGRATTYDVAALNRKAHRVVYTLTANELRKSRMTVEQIKQGIKEEVEKLVIGAQANSNLDRSIKHFIIQMCADRLALPPEGFLVEGHFVDGGRKWQLDRILYRPPTRAVSVVTIEGVIS